MTGKRRRSARGSGIDLRAEILAAARTLLAETGSVEAVSIRAIGHAVGVSAPSIYRHFADKDLLIAAVCNQVFTDLDLELADALGDAGSPLDRMLWYGIEFVRFARAHPEQYRVGMMQIQSHAQALDMTLANGAFQRLVGLIGDCMNAGFMVRADPTPLALEAWACAHGIASLQITKPWLPWADLDAAVERTLRASIVGYCVLGRTDPRAIPAELLDWSSTPHPPPEPA
jgi:AcrR family transcriptional regulator